MARMRKYRSFTDGLINGSSRPLLPFEVGPMDGTKREKAVLRWRRRCANSSKRARRRNRGRVPHRNKRGWIPARSATPSTALVPQRKVGFPIPNASLLLGFQGTKTARRGGISSPFSDAGGCTSPQNSGGGFRAAHFASGNSVRCVISISDLDCSDARYLVQSRRQPPDRPRATDFDSERYNPLCWQVA
jgi:hypothetical protein